jgi:hypothetical protein
MARSHERDALNALRRRARASGYDIYALDDDGYVLARRHPGHRREPVLGRNGGVTLETIERWLNDNEPDPDLEPP